MFNPSNDAMVIRQCITKPRNLKGLIDIVAHRSNEQRQYISQEYFKQFKKSLFDDLKNELSGNFEDAVIALFYPPVDYDCYQLRKAMKGLGTNEDTLIEILATRSNERINLIKQRYHEMYNRDLIKDIDSDTSGFFRDILKKLLEANRPNNPYPDEQECSRNAKDLYDAGIQKKGREQLTYLYILTQKSREELAMISKIYYKWYSKTLFQEIENAYDGKPSIFDNIGETDLVFAFFPCTRFEAYNPSNFQGKNPGFKKWSELEKLKYSMGLHEELHKLYMLIGKLFAIALGGGGN